MLDAFEDPVYDLTRIALVDGRHGWGYACNAGAAVEAHDWSAEDFQARDLSTYVERCATWRRRYEQQEQAG